MRHERNRRADGQGLIQTNPRAPRANVIKNSEPPRFATIRHPESHRDRGLDGETLVFAHGSRHRQTAALIRAKRPVYPTNHLKEQLPI